MDGGTEYKYVWGAAECALGVSRWNAGGLF